MFKEILHETVSRTEGCLGALIMGIDGLTVEQVWRSAAESSDLEIAVAEFVTLINNFRRAGSALTSGNLNEITLSGESGIFVFRFVNRNYFMAMVLSIEGNQGRGRYELSRAELQVGKELVF